ncbi:MAG TPA: hypothetical protein VNG51_27755 [Ktedonobacteraceae bacterium]|nr:hypothetical protein [Ktedonobacteraceae bacterium]
MNCDELAQFIPDMVESSLPTDVLTEAEAMLPHCPECERELAVARQIRSFLLRMQAENANLRVPVGFEARLLARVQAQHSSLELLDLSSNIFGAWLVEMLNLIGGLIDPTVRPSPATLRRAGPDMIDCMLLKEDLL